MLLQWCVPGCPKKSDWCDKRGGAAAQSGCGYAFFDPAHNNNGETCCEAWPPDGYAGLLAMQDQHMPIGPACPQGYTSTCTGEWLYNEVRIECTFAAPPSRLAWLSQRHHTLTPKRNTARYVQPGTGIDG